MQNKNTIIILLTIIILILGYVAFLKPQNVNQNYVSDNQIPVTDNTTNTPTQNNTDSQADNWIYTTTPGMIIAYKSDWTVTPQYYVSTAMQAQGKTDLVGYMFTLPDGNPIIVGGAQSSCTTKEINEFKYGVSTIACVKNMSSNVGVLNVRNTLPQNDINLFGDFVLKNSTTNNNAAVTTTLPQYMGTYQNGWPPVIRTSPNAYSCMQSAGTGDVPTITTQKIINGKNYCITSFVDGAMSHVGGDYTYTRVNGTGTKIATFKLYWPSCGVYGSQTDPIVIQCNSNQAIFFSNLDTLIASLM